MLGERLTKLRKERDITQNQLAKIFNMSRSTYAQYEVDRRNPDYATLKMFAEYFNVSTDYLLGRTNDPTPKNYNTQIIKEDELTYRVTDDRFGEVVVKLKKWREQGITFEDIEDIVEGYLRLKKREENRNRSKNN